jgi:hypothetical protein
MAVNRERKLVSVEQDTIDIDGRTLKQMAEHVAYLIANYGEAATVSKEQYRYDDGYYFAVLKDVPETDEQMNTRIAQEEIWEKQYQSDMKAQYERLAKIYGEKK